MTNADEDDATDVAQSLAKDERTAESGLLTAPPPEPIADLAHACIGFVERAVGVKLDFLPETLPLLDHYLAGARTAHPEGLALVAQTAGAYLGEVIRRRYASWWRLDPASPEEHRLEFHRLQLVVHPVLLVVEALTHEGGQAASLSGFDLDPEDAEAAIRRLEDLPEVPIEEFVSPSTRLEVLDIVVDAARTQQASKGFPALELEPGDYVH